MSLIHIIESAPFRAFQRLNAALQSPFLSGPLLAALALTPADVKHDLLRQLPFLPAVVSVELVEKAVRVLFGLGLVKTLNRALSSLAANNYRLPTAAPGWDWPNEVAVVTGGASGIGQCIARRLAARGVRVAVLDVQVPDDEKKKNNKNDGNDDVDSRLIRYYQCDVTSPEAVAAAADAVRAQLGHPTILVNNAGFVRPVSILDAAHAYLQKIFAINTMSHWLTVQQFLPHMVRHNKGHVVTVASIASFVALPKGADYSATKAAALSFHESLACELKHLYKADRVLTTVAHPNFVRTPLVQDFGHQLEKGGVRMLTPDGVAATITDQIFARRAAQLIIPEHQAVICGLRGWPAWLQTFLRDQMGANAINVSV